MSYEEEYESATVDDFSDEEFGALDEDVEARLDAILRQKFDRAFPVLDQSRQVLGQLKPAVVRARRRRVAAQGVGWMSATCLVLVVGVVALGPLAPSDGESVVAGPTEIVADSTPAPSVSLTTPADALSDGSGPATTIAGELEPVQPSSSTPPSTSGETTTVTGLSASTIQEPTTNPPVTTTSAQPTTTVTTLNGTTSIPGSMRLEDEDCGAIIFLAEDGQVELLGTELLGADREDVKSSGPNKIEVSFEGGGQHCELEAEFKDGRLQTSISNE